MRFPKGCVANKIVSLRPKIELPMIIFHTSYAKAVNTSVYFQLYFELQFQIKGGGSKHSVSCQYDWVLKWLIAYLKSPLF